MFSLHLALLSLPLKVVPFAHHRLLDEVATVEKAIAIVAGGKVVIHVPRHWVS